MSELTVPGASRLDVAVFTRPVLELARALLGMGVLVDGVGGVIVETEAYHHADPASHSHAGPTPRNAAMFGPPAHAYVYRSYGIHWCLNFVGGPEPGSGVLIRALQPAYGVEVMRARRGGTQDVRKLCSGPGRLGQALGITVAHTGASLTAPPFRLFAAEGVHAVAVGPRIGVSRGVDSPWRFGVAGSAFLSRPFPSTP